MIPLGPIAGRAPPAGGATPAPTSRATNQRHPADLGLLAYGVCLTKGVREIKDKVGLGLVTGWRRHVLASQRPHPGRLLRGLKTVCGTFVAHSGAIIVDKRLRSPTLRLSRKSLFH
jgi:hypothetical protein